jgi:hypothetical protein
MTLNERIEAALERIKTGQAAMRVPVEATDPDIVLADCATAIAALRALAVQLGEAMKRGYREGCVDHLDCSDDGGNFWHDALAAFEAAKKEGIL